MFFHAPCEVVRTVILYSFLYTQQRAVILSGARDSARSEGPRCSRHVLRVIFVPLMKYSEPLSITLRRTVGLALAIGIGVGLVQHRLRLIPVTTLLALWFTLGGHFVDLFCWNVLAPKVTTPKSRVWARLAGWFMGGTALYAGMLGTRWLLTAHGPPSWPWWIGGAFFIAAELIAHLLLLLRGRPSVYADFD